MKVNDTIKARILDTGELYCENKRLYDHSKLKFIIVGDNPGEKEYERAESVTGDHGRKYKHGEFFIGPSGQILRNHFVKLGLSSDFDAECLLFNKMPIHTKATSDLYGVRERITKEFFDEILQSCAQEVAALAGQLKKPVLIFGKGEIKINKLFSAFWQRLNSEMGSTNVYVFSHPSQGAFSAEWKKYSNKEDYADLTPEQLLFKIGRINTDLVNATYQEIKKRG